jgi:hypothetical protein
MLLLLDYHQFLQHNHVECQEGCTRASERFFRKAINAEHNQEPVVINVDKNAVSPVLKEGFPP